MNERTAKRTNEQRYERTNSETNERTRGQAARAGSCPPDLRARSEIQSKGRTGLWKGGRDEVPVSGMSVTSNDVMPLVGGRKPCADCVAGCYALELLPL